MTRPNTPPIPVTIVTGFLGSGKTTLLLKLIPQLPPTYKLALLKNEFGDVAVDSQLASTQSISGVRELLNGCICCNLVGQLGDALLQLRQDVGPDRIVIETSGSAFPATLAMEVNRLSREHAGAFVLDGVVSVIDVENWAGYEDTSYTAKMQAKYTDLVVFNKWEGVPEQRFDVCLDRLGDLGLDTPTPWVKSDRGRVERDVLLGIDGALLATEAGHLLGGDGGGDDHHDGHEHDHQSEVEVLSVTLAGDAQGQIDLPAFEHMLQTASKEEVYRIKGVIRCAPGEKLQSSDPIFSHPETASSDYILNWAFGRWTFTPASVEADSIVRLTFILARYESAKWKKKLEAGGLVQTTMKSGELKVEKLL
jgi:G3E family GTPase